MNHLPVAPATRESPICHPEPSTVRRAAAFVVLLSRSVGRVISKGVAKGWRTCLNSENGRVAGILCAIASAVCLCVSALVMIPRGGPSGWWCLVCNDASFRVLTIGGTPAALAAAVVACRIGYCAVRRFVRAVRDEMSR